MFKATEVEIIIKEINLLIDMQINLFVQNFIPLFLALQRLSWDSVGTKNISSIRAQNFWKVNKS